MNSKSFRKEPCAMDEVKENKSFEFVKLYKSAAETKVVPFETTNWSKKVRNLNKNSQSESDTSKRSRSPNKIKKKKGNETLDLSSIEAAENSSSKTTRSSRKNSLTSTPNGKSEDLNSGVKSIMKNKSSDPLLNVSNVSTPSNKPKKRNKSVSFMLEDAEEVVMKKSKSNDSGKTHKHQERKFKEKLADTRTRKEKKSQSKENQNISKDVIKSENKETVATDTVVKHKIKDLTQDMLTSEEVASGVKKKVKKVKKSKLDNEKVVEISEGNVTAEQSSENKSKKLKKKKRKAKSIQDGNTDVEGEPTIKTRKKELKPEAIAKGLENLNIGDNAHTLSNLLDEMTVVDRNMKKKDRQKQKGNKLKKTVNSEDKQEEAPEEVYNVEEKEKVKWKSRKWNKDTKGGGKPQLNTSVVVENLPIKIMCTYKTLLSEHFKKFGTIAGIGVAEAYPTEDCKPVFTTTVFFQEEEAATKALAEDNTSFEGGRIRVRRPQPPTETTLVVRAYALSDQALSTLFSSAGRVRAIRQLIKGKKSMSTAFVEFDGPEAVERALKIAEDATINGKKMYVSKFEIRQKRKYVRAENNDINNGDNDSSTE